MPRPGCTVPCATGCLQDLREAQNLVLRMRPVCALAHAASRWGILEMRANAPTAATPSPNIARWALPLRALSEVICDGPVVALWTTCAAPMPSCTAPPSPAPVDNATTESFWGRLKTASVHGRKFATRRQAAQALMDWVAFYNHSRLHSSLGYVSPMQFEQRWFTAQGKGAA